MRRKTTRVVQYCFAEEVKLNRYYNMPDALLSVDPNFCVSRAGNTIPEYSTAKNIVCQFW